MNQTTEKPGAVLWPLNRRRDPLTFGMARGVAADRRIVRKKPCSNCGWSVVLYDYEFHREPYFYRAFTFCNRCGVEEF